MSLGYYDDFSQNALGASPPAGWTRLLVNANLQPTIVNQPGNIGGRSTRFQGQDEGMRWDVPGQGTRVFFVARVQRGASNGYVQFKFGSGTILQTYVVRIDFSGITVTDSSGIVGQNNTKGTPPVNAWFYVAALLDLTTGEVKAVWWDGTSLTIPGWDIDVVDPTPGHPAGYLSVHGGQSGLKYIDWIELHMLGAGEDPTQTGEVDENGQITVVTGPRMRVLTIDVPGCGTMVIPVNVGTAAAGEAAGEGTTDEAGQTTISGIDAGRHTVTIVTPHCGTMVFETDIT